jgi:hypothetical protein
MKVVPWVKEYERGQMLSGMTLLPSLLFLMRKDALNDAPLSTMFFVILGKKCTRNTITVD